MFLNFYQCDRCGQAETAALAKLAYYRLDDGRRVGCSSEPAWCYSCNHVRSVERIPDVGRLEALLEQQRTGKIDDQLMEIATLLGQTPESLQAQKLEDWETTLEWRKARQSPPKCLECGGTSFLVLWPESRDTRGGFVHPTCAGTFRLASEAHARQACYRILDPEGRFLEDE